jgi:heterodisulfide reductase subunit B
MDVELCYYPGCTLKTTGKNFESPAIASMEALGHPMVELERWNCCGTVHSLASDDLIHQLAPVRTMIRARDSGAESVVTLCAMCNNTLKQTNLIMEREPDKRDRINSFLDEEKDYGGETSVLHLLEFLRDHVGFDELAKKVKRPLEGLRLAPYYGCLLLRPEDAAIDDAEAPAIMEDLIAALGGEAVDSPLKIECCGSYHTVNDIDPVVERARAIIGESTSRGADALVVACPLCFFNLDYRQKDIAARYRNWSPVPVLYFTQLMALALGLDEAVCLFDEHHVDPRPMLREKDLADGGPDGA